jgi:hypothetical protein
MGLKASRPTSWGCEADERPGFNRIGWGGGDPWK